MHSITRVHKDKIISVYIKGMKEDCEFKFVWINQSPESLINNLSEWQRDKIKFVLKSQFSITQFCDYDSIMKI